MRSLIKRLFFPVLFCGTLAMNVSCLGDLEENKTPEACITSFVVGYYNVRFHDVNIQGRDTIVYEREAGVMYPMTIDQANNRIYNIDSLAYGSQIDSVTCSVTYTGYLLYQYLDESYSHFWSASEAIDFTRPLRFIVYSSDESYVRTYDFKLNVHTVFPDSVLWRDTYSAGFTPLSGQCAVVRGDTILDFGTDANGTVKVVYRDVRKGDWTAQAVSGLPSDGWTHNVVLFNDSLFSVSGNSLYVSGNGIDWNPVRSGIKSIVPSLNANDRIWAFSVSDSIINSSDMRNWTAVQKIPQGFMDTVAIAYSCPLATNPNIMRTVLVGSRKGDAYSSVWIKLSTDSVFTRIDEPVRKELCLPLYESLSVIWYDNALYAFGLGLDGFRESGDNGLTWYYCSRYADYDASWDRYMQMPKAIRNTNTGFSYATDGLGGIWIMTDDGKVLRGAKTILDKLK